MLFGAAVAFGGAVAMADDTDRQATLQSDADSQQPGTDAWITAKVKSELMATRGIPSTEISVATTNGVVTLVGVLDDRAEVERSIVVARNVKGVRNVDASALTSRRR
ncbi:MAG TPA: BON domain-containing protein [Rudaea sp.]|nr:BON domain-containing protein [Rudaea sp.]